MAKIKIKEQNRGKFTAWAKAHGMSVQEAANKILRNREKYSPALIKRANFARNASKWDEGGQFEALPKHFIGGLITAGMGIFQQIQQQREQKELLEDQNKANSIGAMQMGQAGIMNNYPSVFKSGGQFKGKKFGGKPNAIVGGGEIVITPDGMPTNMKGPSDIGGPGISVALPDQSIIISKKNSKDILPLTNKINKNSEVLKGNSATMFAKNSAKRNLSKYYSTVMDTYNRQELKKFYDGGGWRAPQLPGENRNPYWPQGGMDALNTITGNYGPSINGGMLGNVDVQGQGIYSPGEATVTGYRNSQIPTYLNPNTPGYTGAPPTSGMEPYLNSMQPWWRPGSNAAPSNESIANSPVATSTIPVASAVAAANTGKIPVATPSSATSPTTAPTTQSTWGGNIGGMNQHLNSLMPQLGTYGTEFGKASPVAGLAGNGLAGAPKQPLAPEGTDWGNVLGSIGEMAPMLYNLGRGLFGKKDTVNANRYANPYEGQINSLMGNRRYNIDAPLAANEAAFRTTSANMRNLGGSRGQVMANLTGAENTKQFADMAAYGQQNNVNNQYRGEQASMQYGLGRDTVNTKMMVDEGNRMTDAAKSNMVGAGMTGLQQYLLTRRQMKNQDKQGRLLINAMRARSPYTDQWIPGLDTYYDKKKGR